MSSCSNDSQAELSLLRLRAEEIDEERCRDRTILTRRVEKNEDSIEW